MHWGRFYMPAASEGLTFYITTMTAVAHDHTGQWWRRRGGEGSHMNGCCPLLAITRRLLVAIAGRQLILGSMIFALLCSSIADIMSLYLPHLMLLQDIQG